MDPSLWLPGFFFLYVRPSGCERLLHLANLLTKVPQLIENYKCGSAEGVSLSFLTVWLLGDITNFFGAVWAGLVPTVIVLAVYFCFLDSVLITQCLYYNFINARKARRKQSVVNNALDPDSPHQPLLDHRATDPARLPASRRRSSISQRRRSSRGSSLHGDTISRILEDDSSSKVWVKNTVSILLVCLAGAAGWAIAWRTGVWTPTPDETGGESVGMERGPQTLGYLSAVCYLGCVTHYHMRSVSDLLGNSARIPQIIKNYREQSCEGMFITMGTRRMLGILTDCRPLASLFHLVDCRQCYIWMRRES